MEAFMSTTRFPLNTFYQDDAVTYTCPECRQLISISDLHDGVAVEITTDNPQLSLVVHKMCQEKKEAA